MEPDPAPRSGPKRPDFETSDFCRAERAFPKREIRWPAWHWGVESAKGSNASEASDEEWVSLIGAIGRAPDPGLTYLRRALVYAIRQAS